MKLDQLYKIEFVRYLIISGVNTIFGFSVFSLFIYLHFHYSIASLLSTVAGIIFNFKTTGFIVFKNKNNKLFVKFFLVYGILYLINVLSLKSFNLFHVNLYLAGGILLIPMSLISYILNKKFVFGGGR